MEIHLFILWSKANCERKIILSDIAGKFTILDIYNISWSKDKFSENLSRFYGQNLPRNSKKEQHCGNETFTCIIVRDKNPLYEPRQTSKGIRVVNVNLFDSKKLYRSWTGGGHKIHATDDIEETRIQLMLLLEKQYDNYLVSNEIFVAENEYNQDLIGSNGWGSLEDVFDILNKTINYVVLRNFETIHDEMDSQHPDIDVLTDNQDNAISILNAQKTIQKKYRVQYKVLIDNKEINFDLRFIGDNYYDINWQKDILATRIKEKFYYRPTSVNYFYSLLYHALLHKAKFGIDYQNRLLELNDKYSIISNRKYLSVLDVFNNLEEFIGNNKYYFTYPNDFSVFWNYKLYDKVNSSWSILHKGYRTYASIMKLVGDTKKSIAGWLVKLIKRSVFFQKNHLKINRVLIDLNVMNIKVFKFKNWHDGFAYYSGIFKGDFVFIKISTKHLFLENEKIFYDIFKNDLSLLKVMSLSKNNNIQILISEFSEEKELTEQDILDNPDRLLQIYEILKIINSRGCIHRDIKLNNFLLKDDEVRVIDFTFSTSLNHFNMFKDLSLVNKEDAVILKNLGGIYKPNIFQWNDFYSIDLILDRLFSEDMDIEKRLKIIKYKELFKGSIPGNDYSLLK
jgi:hypothetical protein